jgi:hypothetical protein
MSVMSAAMIRLDTTQSYQIKRVSSKIPKLRRCTLGTQLDQQLSCLHTRSGEPDAIPKVGRQVSAKKPDTNACESATHDGFLLSSLNTNSRLLIAGPLERAVSIAQKPVKIQLVLPDIPLDIHQLADQDCPALDFKPAVFGRC